MNTQMDTQMDVGFSFGKVIDLMKVDSSIRFQRSGWNGKNMYIFYVREQNTIITKEHIFDKIYVEGAVIKQEAYIAMKTVGDTVIPWLSSQADMLADDWEIIGGKKNG